ncbi:MAG: acyl--CoA ligase [Ilumatobacteraceae bacterium]|nr:acyl--CoA ligase [Ilumatobacteraceae bacterium]
MNGSPRSLADYLWHWESTSPDRPFASDGTGAGYTYAETAAAVRALSAEFARRGASAGDRVAVLAENSSAWIIAFLAGLASGLVGVPLATRLTTDELDVLLDNADPGVIAVDAALLPVVGSRWRDRTILLSDAVLSEPGPAADADLATRIDGDTPACLTYTSGTTSRPKGVLLSNVGLSRASETYAAMFHSTPAMHTIVAVPLCHNTGFVDQLGHALVAGGSIEAHRRFRADEIARRLHTGECTFFIGVPTMYQRIDEHLTDTPPCELAPWLAFGGAPMPSQLIVHLHEHFPNARLANCYGLSEATSITHVNFVESGGSATEVGVAVAGTIDRISPAGELLIQSPTAMLGYYRDPEATTAKFEDGWLRTGDLAARADNGMVQVFGRVDEVINRGGEKVVPLEVEEALCTHPAVVEAAVVGLPDEQYGSIVAAAVVTSEPIAGLDLGRFLEGSLADYKRPAQIVGVGELPRNQNGKVVTADVRDLITRVLDGLGAQP